MELFSQFSVTPYVLSKCNSSSVTVSNESGTILMSPDSTRTNNHSNETIEKITNEVKSLCLEQKLGNANSRKV